jgi:hypothetical protein
VALPLDRSEKQEPFLLTVEHAQLTGDATLKLFKVPLGRSLRIERVTYLNVTGLAEDTTNVFEIAIAKGDTPTTIASHSTDSDLMVADAGVPADAFLDIPITAAADIDTVIVGGAADGDDELLAVFTEGGAATLPAGKLIIEGHWVAG